MTTLTSPALTTAWHVATWIDVAPQAPFALADLHDALDPICGQTEMLRIVNALIRYGLIHQTTRHGREWVADRPLLTRGDDLAEVPDREALPVD